ncbi:MULTISPECIES: hypothetical protein [Serratia]|uniref:hypothetical protein n=1 Tax=Serratia TaxID=613 RepID=UPI00188CAC73|nr:hypothetical protein [Serratia marcescens]MBF8217132.1 hypothetical protein [Serratia ureilytica]MBF4653796.1 hypothetical protein [Serratia marcescens]MBF8242117.1 hypothetical protein [Serratia ureilytica]MBH1915564.1 hypothetical protein [Serratia marcescens]MBH2675477.1 hypothetical protein [Serratia marcescens]
MKKRRKSGIAHLRVAGTAALLPSACPETFPISSFISRMRLLMAHLHIMIYQSAATGDASLLPSAIYLLEMIFVRSYITASAALP